MHIHSSLLRSVIFFICLSLLFLFGCIAGCISDFSSSTPEEIKDDLTSITHIVDSLSESTNEAESAETDTSSEQIPGVSSDSFSFSLTPISSISPIPTPPISLTDTSMLAVSGLYTISPEHMRTNPLRLLIEVDVANTARLDAKNVQLDYEFRYNGNVVKRETIHCGIIVSGDVRSRSKTVFISFSDNLFVKFQENPSDLSMHLVGIRAG